MRALAAAAFVIVLAGCASGPGKDGATTSKSEPRAIQSARQYLTNASPESLAKAASELKAPDLAASPDAQELAGLGRELFAMIYPEIADNPFPADSSR